MLTHNPVGAKGWANKNIKSPERPSRIGRIDVRSHVRPPPRTLWLARLHANRLQPDEAANLFL